MKIRVKVFVSVVTLFGLLFFGISWMLAKVETANFVKLEKQDVTDEMIRLQAAMQTRFDDLELRLLDWTQWDDTYDFVQNHNQEYIDVNLEKNSLTLIKINFVIIKDENGETVVEKYVTKYGEESIFPSELSLLFSKPEFLKHENGLLNRKGLIKTSQGYFVIAIQSVTSSDGLSQPKGFMAFGYALDDSFVESLAKRTYLKLDYSEYQDIKKSIHFASAKEKLSFQNNIYVDEKPDPDLISGSILLSDIFNQPILIFQASIPRTIYRIGLENIETIKKLLVGMGFFGTILILILFEIFVLRRIRRLASSVQSVGQGNKDEIRIFMPGKDEFAQLGLEINKMLDVIMEANAEKKESESRFLHIADTAPVMIWISDEKNKIIYVNKAIVEFLGKTEKELFGDAWTDVIHADDRKGVLEKYKKAAENKELLSMKYRVMTSRKKYQWILVRATARMSTRGVFKGYTGTAVDVNEFEESNLKQKKDIHEFERMNRLMVLRELKMMELKKELRECKGIMKKN